MARVAEWSKASEMMSLKIRWLTPRGFEKIIPPLAFINFFFFLRGFPGIEPGISRTLNENPTTRPESLLNTK